jgi:hypothetical protein
MLHGVYLSEGYQLHIALQVGDLHIAWSIVSARASRSRVVGLRDVGAILQLSLT